MTPTLLFLLPQNPLYNPFRVFHGSGSQALGVEMKPLNENYDFMRDASPNDRAAFRNPPRRTLFAPGTEFVRMVTTENARTADDGNKIFGSSWWLSRATFRELVRLSDPRHLGITSVARIGLAVTKEFNPKMDWVSIIYLTEAVYGWAGPAARQLASPTANIYLGGGKEQIYIPNLAKLPNPNPGKVRDSMSSDYARMRFFGLCPEYF